MSTPPMMSLRPATSAWTSRPCPILICRFSFPVRQDRLCELQVLRIRHLEVLAAAGDQARVEPELLHRARLVGDGALRLPQRLREQAGAEQLRGLREPDLCAVLGAG